MKRLITIMLAIAFISVAAIAIANNGPAQIKLEAKPGTVTFEHAKHQGRAGDCKTCHHDGVEAGACRTCHDGAKAPKAKDAFHKLCKDCHKKNNGPTKCKGCHVK